MMRVCTFSSLVVSALTCLLLAGTPAYAQAYRVTDLGPVGTVAAAINNAGQVTGSTPVGSPYKVPHAFLWTPGAPNAADGSLHDLGGLPGNPLVSSHGTALDEAGQVVGDSNAVTGPFVSFLNTGLGPFHVVSFKNGAITDLGAPPGFPAATSDLGAPPGFPAATATGVNASGQIAGTAVR